MTVPAIGLDKLMGFLSSFTLSAQICRRRGKWSENCIEFSSAWNRCTVEKRHSVRHQAGLAYIRQSLSREFLFSASEILDCPFFTFLAERNAKTCELRRKSITFGSLKLASRVPDFTLRKLGFSTRYFVNNG